ncbi:MAG: hypothetical protein ACFE7R_09465 [Candidatus Hodarchaeota archaeon]
MENPEIRLLLELRRELEEELEEIREKIAKIEAYVQALDSIIGVRSFTTADAAITDTSRGTAEAATERPSSIQIMNKARDLELATIAIDDQDLTITPAQHALYDIKRGAFARFFVERILGQFQQEDRHRVENEEISWEEAFDFEVRAEDGILQEVIIRNFGDDNRLGEIQRAVRWALEKTYRAR